jgi:dTDP-4-amino-4,6-dideoxygalactose transaminase
MSLNLSKGDYLWTTPISFVASANCALYCGAKVDFVDIDINTFNISIDELEKKLKITPKNKLPKIIILVHLSGHPIDLVRVKKLSLKYKFKIIEDASHAVGSFYKQERIGNCKYSDICIFSFHPVKIITTGEGGSILTNSKKIFNRVTILRSHGIVKNIKFKSNPWHYDQKYLGYNYRMNDIEAALGISQLSRLDKFVMKRNKISLLYKYYLDKKKIKFQSLLPETKSSMHLFVIRVNKQDREKIYYNLKKKGINTNLHYIPIYRHSFYKKFAISKKKFKNAEIYYKEAISLPLYFDLKKSDQLKIIKIINNTLSKNFLS